MKQCRAAAPKRPLLPIPGELFIAAAAFFIPLSLLPHNPAGIWPSLAGARSTGGIGSSRQEAGTLPRRVSGAQGRLSAFLTKAGLHQLSQRLQSLFGLTAMRADSDHTAGAGRQHHQPHNRISPYLHAVFFYPYFGVKTVDKLHKTGGSARMQAQPVTNLQLAA